MVGAARPHPNRSRGDLGDPRGRGHAAASGLGRSRGVRRFARISRDRRGSRPPNVDRNPRRGSLENAGSNGDAYSRTSHGRRRSGHLQDHLQGQKLTSAAALLTTCGGFSGLGLRPLHCQGQGHSRQMCLHVQPAGSSVVATATTSPGRVVPSPSSKEKLNCHHHGRNRSWASGSSGSTLRGAGQLPRTSRHCARCRTTRSGPSARPARMPRASPARRSESPRCSPTMRSWWLSPMST